ncbi:hypothetical protein [Kitasatospora brasiliensis]|uniref:hypothetical protein n=1 Tax=Kitasatospora brasiliensis TaxID=3058040 RepID=UPI00292CA798|nr:hypothetical protein [Kitasatospora sp. K002]
MTTNEEFLARIREIQAARENAIGPLGEVLAERQRLAALMADTDEPYGRAYENALTAGWREDELANLGAPPPVSRPKGRPRKTSRPKKAVPVQAAAVHDGSDDEVVAVNGSAG